MNSVLLIAGRELKAYFRSPLAAVVLSAGLLIAGVVFYVFGLSAENHYSAFVLRQLFYYFSGVVMTAALLLSMRLIAEERQTGSAPLLQTAPVAEHQIVLGKFLSAWAMIALLCTLSLYMPALIFVNGKVSVGHIAVGYLGVLLLGGAVTAIGLFGSALARSQILALITGAVILLPLLVLWALARVVEPPFDTVLARLAIHHQNQLTFMEGVLELDRVVYYLALIFFFLLAATKSLEARRWR